MRNNQPVTQQEYVLADDDFLISRTDLKGIITYASPAFIRASGFSLGELMGKNHNIVRHPDMPPAGFSNLWDTIKAGKSWNGFVKNRRKNGDHYWVYANVTPFWENGRIAGYTSVRIKPSREDVAKADAAYREIMAGRGKNLTLHRGELSKKGFSGLLMRMRLWRSLRGRMSLVVIFGICLLIGSAILSYLGMDAPPEKQVTYILSLAILSVIGSMGMGLLGYITMRSVMKPLQSSLDFTAQLAAGNLDAKLLQGDFVEIKRLTTLLETMRKSLISIASDIHADMGSFSASASEIARGNEHLAQRTGQQASSLQQTATSMEQLTGTVEQNAGNARQASQLAADATNSVQVSGQVMHQVVSTMDAISDSSHKMRDIINVIDSIAFQTNILALNASVEAARAGEQGRGFSVVASEVRNLASRSASAAREIRELIDKSVHQVEEGAALVRNAELGIEEVVHSVMRVNDIMGEISIASGEQSSGITQVNQAVAQMDAVTQQNAILVEDAARIAKQLEDQVSEVEQSIAVFRFGRVARRAAI